MTRPGVAITKSTPVVQRLDLALHAGPAVDGVERHRADRGERRQLVVHLQRQLPGRHQHDGRRPVGLGLVQALEDGQAERQRLARAGLGLAADVTAGEAVGDRQGLDRKGARDAPGCERVAEVGRDPEGPEPVATGRVRRGAGGRVD